MMIRSNQLLFFLLMVAIAISACDKVSPPNYGCTNPLALNYDSDATLDDGNCEFDPSILRGCTDTLASNFDPMALVDDCHCRYENLRTVLLEDYTGFRCPNCPRAAEALKDLECMYGTRIVPLAVHVGQTFASPINPEGNPFSTDFRTSIGAAYDAEFGNSLFLPNGLVNRTPFNGGFPQLHADWAGQAAGILAQPAEALLSIDVNYNEGNRVATADVGISVVSDLNNPPYRIVVLLSEDSVVDWQLDNAITPPEIEDYVHNHVLRDGFTTAWGNLLNAGAAMPSGHAETTTVSLTIDQAFRAQHCNVVAFIFRDDTKQVIQAEYRAVIEE